MKVRVITEDSIWSYCKANARSKPSFHIFLEKLKNCDWSDLNDMKNDFPKMSIVGNCSNNRIVFDIGGNNYRVICDYNFYKTCCLYVAFICTHAEYDKVDACTVQMF
ncbi:MAG: type II toxin-antitoxin system HigB family toxin [Crocinitomicaceae bacterium]|nr:type II toxin-antitoxin system HigB family toxin [Crocinitomicaceae bacterium]